MPRTSSVGSPPRCPVGSSRLCGRVAGNQGLGKAIVVRGLFRVQAPNRGGLGIIGVGYAVPSSPRAVQPMERSSSNFRCCGRAASTAPCSSIAVARRRPKRSASLEP